MRGLVTSDINERLRPFVNATLTGTYDANEIVDIVGSETGEDVDQNDQWYKLSNGRYLWSGGVRVHLSSGDLPAADRTQFLISYRLRNTNGRPNEASKSAPDQLYFTPLILPADNDSVTVAHWDEDTFSAVILNAVAKMPPERKHVMIYIHGYQLQLISSLKLDLLSSFVTGYMWKRENTIAKMIYLSWPSQSGPKRETVDDRSIDLGTTFTSNGFFKYFIKLSEALRKTGRTLNLVAHSFGHQLLNGMINPLPTLDPAAPKVFENVFLMAPDISHFSAEQLGGDVTNIFLDPSRPGGGPATIRYDLSPLMKLANSVHVFYDKFDYLLYSSTIRFAGEKNLINTKEMNQYLSLGNYGKLNLKDMNKDFNWYDVQELTKGSTFDNLWDFPFRPLKNRLAEDISKIWSDPSDYSDINGFKIFTHKGLFEDHHRYLFTCEPVVNKVLEILG